MLTSRARRRGHHHRDVAPQRDFTGRVRGGEAGSVLRAGEPGGPRVAQGRRRRPEQGQGVPARDRPAAVRRRRVRVQGAPRRARRVLPRARLRAGRVRGARRIR
ncbi:hypothetical protein PR202_gb15276 [Eleusine coracana subsp. coracana]|uniref:Uncharacterized protein n=1 Tax=Eleusine coracana subsp. coracana TaxID=191504 RepID=A0AAV5EV37_ELECO|nr:hypothetical protein PR202_gb15276 [Eleusine coracana subsp. coracana]